jgi:diadenosine tetraphosphate (Ap4A) HIT family hydrolase
VVTVYLSTQRGFEADNMKSKGVFPGCDFCSELNEGSGDRFSDALNGRCESRLVLRMSDLCVFPSLGEIVPGHLLIVPSYHVTAFTSIAPKDKAVLAQLIPLINRTFRFQHGEEPIFFEHGDPSGLDVFNGQCISHAHIHVLPHNVDMLAAVKRERRFLASAKINAPSVPVAEPYVALIESDLTAHFFSSVNAPRQYLRALYSRLVGEPGGENWFERTDVETTLRHAARYREAFHVTPQKT